MKYSGVYPFSLREKVRMRELSRRAMKLPAF